MAVSKQVLKEVRSDEGSRKRSQGRIASEKSGGLHPLSETSQEKYAKKKRLRKELKQKMKLIK